MEKIKIEIDYKGMVDDELNASLDACAESNGGAFESFYYINTHNRCVRTFSFVDSVLMGEFYETANLIISKHFGFVLIEMDDLYEESKWNMDIAEQEGIYHHLSFLELKDASKFAISLRATFSSYTSEDNYDIMLVKGDKDNYYVVYGFPLESEISLDIDSKDEDSFDLFPSLNKIDKTKLN
jgi:hypothetical protein